MVHVGRYWAHGYYGIEYFHGGLTINSPPFGEIAFPVKFSPQDLTDD